MDHQVKLEEKLPREVRYILLDVDATIIYIITKWWEPIEEAFEMVVGDVPKEELRSNMAQLMSEIPTDPSKFFMLKLMWRVGRFGGFNLFSNIRFLYHLTLKYRQSRHIARPFPGAESFIQKIKERNIPIVIVTSADRIEMKSAKKKLQFLQDIPVITRNDVDKMKPHFELIIKGITLLQANPEYKIYVWECCTDIEAGKAANVLTVGLLSCRPEISDTGLKKANPDLLLYYLGDLSHIFLIR